MTYHHRLRQLQKKIQNPVLLKKRENIYYATGVSLGLRDEGRYLLVKKNSAVFFGTGLEKTAGAGASDVLYNLRRHIRSREVLEIFGGFTFAEARYIRRLLPDAAVKVMVAPEPVDELRLIKQPEEMRLIKKSMQIVELVFGEVRKVIRPGMTERELAEFIERRGRQLGAEDISFPAIVTSGANAAVPHHVPGPKKMKKGEPVILDFGFMYRHYCSDFTRTVFLGSVPQSLKSAYLQAELAYHAAIGYISAARGPVSAAAVHMRAVEVLAEKKLEKYFIHSLGHGTGLEIHEQPSLHQKSADRLRDGMVFSIEPGLYFPGRGGIRIEDLVYMEQGECKKFITVSTKIEDNVF